MEIKINIVESKNNFSNNLKTFHDYYFDKKPVDKMILYKVIGEIKCHLFNYPEKNAENHLCMVNFFMGLFSQVLPDGIEFKYF